MPPRETAGTPLGLAGVLVEDVRLAVDDVEAVGPQRAEGRIATCRVVLARVAELDVLGESFGDGDGVEVADDRPAR